MSVCDVGNNDAMISLGIVDSAFFLQFYVVSEPDLSLLGLRKKHSYSLSYLTYWSLFLTSQYY